VYNQNEFLLEVLKTPVRRWWNSFEDIVISLHPNAPAIKNDHFHVKRDLELILNFLQSHKRIRFHKDYIEFNPADLCKRTCQKEM